jgi:hypothetical protein
MIGAIAMIIARIDWFDHGSDLQNEIGKPIVALKILHSVGQSEVAIKAVCRPPLLNENANKSVPVRTFQNANDYRFDFNQSGRGKFKFARSVNGD